MKNLSWAVFYAFSSIVVGEQSKMAGLQSDAFHDFQPFRPKTAHFDTTKGWRLAEIALGVIFGWFRMIWHNLLVGRWFYPISLGKTVLMEYGKIWRHNLSRGLADSVICRHENEEGLTDYFDDIICGRSPNCLYSTHFFKMLLNPSKCI